MEISWLNNIKKKKKLSGHTQVLSGRDKDFTVESRELPWQCKCSTSCFSYTTWCKYQNSVTWTLKILAFYWIFIGRTDAEVEAPILWPPDEKIRLIRKDTDAGKDWGHEEKGATEDKMIRWHQRLNGHGFEQTSADSEGQGSPECCSPWGCKELDSTEQLNDSSILNIK